MKRILNSNMLKYQTLLKVLDKICEDAPKEFKKYKFNKEKIDTEKMNRARALAFIHLFLEVKFDINQFESRHALITEGSGDGGIDAYYIDNEFKKIYLIQSKFRTTEDNFAEKSIKANDMIKMEIKNILQGKDKDSKGNPFNDKIRNFQKEYSKINDQANYKCLVIFLGNLIKYSDEQIKKLIDNYDYEIYNYEKVYEELLFPLSTGTHYYGKDIEITINLLNCESKRLVQEIKTQYNSYSIEIIFVPIEEIGRIISKYKNTILKYNPRNYLSLSKNPVNKKIKESVLTIQENDFAILNNGITIVATSSRYTEARGVPNKGQLILTNPQIINGGQTAYTLGKIYQDFLNSKEKKKEVFDSKEVLLKTIILGEDKPNIKLIESISNATNEQSRVNEADRRSNDEIQLRLQEILFKEFGYFYERKKGEFHSALETKMISQGIIIDRDNLLRAYLSFSGDPSSARRSSSDVLFKKEKFDKIMNKSEDYKRIFFSYLILNKLNLIQKEKGLGEDLWGQGIRFGKLAIIRAVNIVGGDELTGRINNAKNIKEIENVLTKYLEKVGKWKDFENYVVKEERESNKDYFSGESFDYLRYYKGNTLNSQLEKFFKIFNIENFD